MTSEDSIAVYSHEDRLRAKCLDINLARWNIYDTLTDRFTQLSVLGEVVEVNDLRDLFRSALWTYSDARCIRPFTTAELSKLDNILPSEKIFRFALDAMTMEMIFDKLIFKSTVKMLCENFPVLDGLNFGEKMIKNDLCLENLRKLDEVPYANHYDRMLSTTYSKSMAEIHAWWNIPKRFVKCEAISPVVASKRPLRLLSLDELARSSIYSRVYNV